MDLNLKRYEDYILEYNSYLKFLRKYRKKDKPYEDHTFHPFKKINEKYNYINPKKIEWKRIDKVYRTSLFNESCIGIDYMEQGEIGDCNLKSALLRIAKEPHLVRKLFDTECNSILGLDENSIDLECGAVVVIFHAFGQTTPVVIDTLIPFIKKTDTPLFSRPSRKDASPWFCLVEKAYAKLNGSYSNIKGCKFYNVFYSLFNFWPTRFSISKLLENEAKSPYQQILDFLKKGSIMSTSIHIKYSKLTERQINKVGLVINHSYLIEEVFNYKRKIFYRLRNPWGRHEWNGEWSNKSPLWTKEMKKDFHFDKLKRGSFWMIESDFFKYFTTMNISSPIHSFFHSKSFSITMDPGDSDGVSPYSKKAKLDKKPNYMMKIIDNVPKDEKVLIKFFIEKNSYLPKRDEEEEDYFSDDDDVDDDDDSKNDDHDDTKNKQIKYDVLLVWSNGKRLTYEVMNRSHVKRKTVKRDLYSFKFDYKKTYSPLTIALQRVKKSNYQDECFIKILCKYKFELFEIDEPEDLIEDDKEEEDIFHNTKLIHLILSKKKVDFIPKISPLMISHGISLKLRDDSEISSDIPDKLIDGPEKLNDKPEKSSDDPKKPKDNPEESKDKPEKPKDNPEESKDKPENPKDKHEKSKDKPEKPKCSPAENRTNKNEIEINAENLIYYEQEKKFMKIKIQTLEVSKKSFNENIDKYLDIKKDLQAKISKNIKKIQTIEDESKVVHLVNRIESKRNQLEINENFLDWNFSKIDEIQSEINEIKKTYKIIKKKIKLFKDNQPENEYDDK